MVNNAHPHSLRHPRLTVLNHPPTLIHQDWRSHQPTLRHLWITVPTIPPSANHDWRWNFGRHLKINKPPVLSTAGRDNERRRQARKEAHGLLLHNLQLSTVPGDTPRRSAWVLVISHAESNVCIKKCQQLTRLFCEFRISFYDSYIDELINSLHNSNWTSIPLLHCVLALDNFTCIIFTVLHLT